MAHHSVSDWDFSSSNWALDTGTYISSPSSLRWNNYNLKALLKHSITGALVQGRIVTHTRYNKGRYSAGFGWLEFRNNSADGGTGGTNYYVLKLKGSTSDLNLPIDQAQLFRYTTALDIRTINPTFPNSTWYKMRLTWWVSSGVLMVRLEYWDGAQWLSMCDDWSDNQNAYASNERQRIGVCGYASSTPIQSWFDDTEIWIPAT